ncbi:PTS beta-glucoside transporter subunit EIIBCA [Streptococcus sp. zg-86]|uniref:PTS beta-glucoside transporter subunit EIIBCA n=1 Tax=Streptococcus zhangguiae TaxID=2664091 RepID=A0A6I4RF66_9STRE|nr:MULTISPECIES: glucose PTS transporter subunit IIA [unclassified Streptococcus]MTB64503.1 PTS beta-glucoside transporter subunit EIIBCA [Streptococcus sp. zg-86]MTB90807.1 PTS beta-glucoside transporter subunit EIIBCA [Streptococcus sp. zg-36]MWV56490.1 PTS beta-glucoside transporter subunit EIIBCA [Streptococcus sp. zg-70]QTH47304.1 PTS glucose transporter subunit IIA [Streptococcus sp. zg-86]
MAYDYKEIANIIIENAGGLENISSVTRCSTRLRLFIKDKYKVNINKIQDTKPVMGVVFPKDELQIVLAQNLIPIYDIVSKEFDARDKSKDTLKTSETEEVRGFKAKVSKIGGDLLAFVSAAVTPMIPALVAGGMLKVFLLLITLALPSFAESSTYNLLSMLADAPFYFMPIFVAYGASTKLGGTALYSMAVMGSLIYPTFVQAVTDKTPLSILGLPILLVSYKGTLLPALLISYFAYRCEKLFTKIIPSLLRSIFVGVFTIAVTYVVGVTVLAPLGYFVGGYVAEFFLWTSTNFGPVAVGLLAASMPFLVLTGMHHAVTPFMAQAVVDPGYDAFFRPAYLLHNMAEGGAVLGVGLRAKDKALRAECFSLAFGCVVAGITEPAIYGVNLRLKRPLYGVIAGAGLGGVVSGLLGATAYHYGYSNLLAIPIFEKTILAIIIAIVVAIVSSCVITMLLGFDESILVTETSATHSEEVDTTASVVLSDTNASSIAAPVSGAVVALSDVDDQVFASGAMGSGVAIKPSEATTTVYSPVDGVVEMAFETGHAYGLKSDSGAEVLIHVGIDTVSLGGNGFEQKVIAKQTVKKGDILGTFDPLVIANAGLDNTTMVIVTNSSVFEHINIVGTEFVNAGQELIELD